MDVRSIDQVPPLPMHHGTVPVWWLVEPRAMKQETAGGYLELVAEFEVAGGGHVDPHSHHTHEYYYVLNGRGIMTVDGEDRDVVPGDFIYIPPDKVHSLRPVSETAPIRALVFAVALADTPEIDYSVN
ncbi:MAG TPA: cupin domain-containing protein [Gaiellaceae bacterium]|nr:cupin domain-containing protein [Gaiellaceae bacterium]